MNSLYQQLNPLRNTIPTSVRQMIASVKSVQNPQAAVQQMMQQNPQLQSLITAANGDPKAAFYSLANKMSVNPDEVLELLK